VLATVPDSVQVLTQYENGARGIYHFSGMEIHGPGKQIHLYGSRGTIKVLFGQRDRLFFGRRPDAELREISIPAEKLGGWRVEAEFVGAIRGQEPVKYTTFADGVRYMEFVEAVARSAAADLPLSLPLGE
jgi:predicted dehydrogenase